MSPHAPAAPAAPNPGATAGIALEVFAPGRVNLIGEHTDYNGGLVLPFAIGLGLELRFGLRDARPGEPALACASTYEEATFALAPADLRAAVEACEAAPLTSAPVSLGGGSAAGSSLSYVAGAVALFLARRSYAAEGEARALLEGRKRLEIRIDSTLPSGAGLSSSAALSTGVATGVQALFGGRLPAGELARTAMYVEHRFAGTKCGLMDQLAVTFGREGSFVAIDFGGMPTGGSFSLEMVKAHEAFADYIPVAFNTGVAHSLASSEYNMRREECEGALERVNALTGLDLPSLGAYAGSPGRAGSPLARLLAATGAETDPATLARSTGQGNARDRLHAAFVAGGVAGDRALVLARRAAHAIFENLRVREAMAALRDGNPAALGAAMRASHASLRDDYQVSCKELDVAVELVPDTCERLARERSLGAPAVVGARMTGGGFGGSTIQLVHHALVEPMARALTSPKNPYTAITGATPRLVVSPPSEGIRLRYL